MDDRQNNAEQKFFQWLPSAVSPSALKDIQTSYIQINALLVKSRVLLRPIVNVTSIRQIEVALQQAKNILANKHLRNTATKLLMAYALYEEYGSVDDFREEVNAGNLKAANVVARIYRDKGWGFFTSLQMFKDWVADVIEGNNLQDTGIIFIWDEFTSYLRNNPTDDVLQPLSEFCKEQPFFMFLIVHRAPSWVSQIGEEVYEQIVHRYHSLDFHVSESAAYELIGSSILTRAGMEEQWNAEKDKLMKSISKNIADFDNLDMSSKKERLRQLCPLHPMTLSLLAIVAQNFGASQRTLFRFMKDTKESEENVGFIYYINNYGPDDWRWLTPDFLWDYFFTRESDVRSFQQRPKAHISILWRSVNTSQTIITCMCSKRPCC